MTRIPKYKKTPHKTALSRTGLQAVGDEGLEQTQQFPRKSNNGPVRDAEYDARCADSGVIDPDLEGLIRAWPNLSESARKEILKHLPSPSSR